MANRRYIDFPIASTSGDTDIILIWQGGANKQTTKATFLSGLPENLDELNDVAISGLTNGQILRYDSVTGKWENTDQGNLDLNDLNDVSIVSPSNGQVLVYNSSTGKWENSSGGFVPYTGAVTTVNLGAQTIQAGQFVKSGGTSAQFLKADGSVDSNTYGTGTVTSVALTMPSAFSVANSPITTSGTLAVTGAGTVGQYIRGDGSLADFPESSGGGSSVSYYLNGSVAQGTIGGVAYKELNKVPILGAGTDFTINGDGYIASFITDAGDPNLLEIAGGNWNFETYFSASSGGGSPTFYVELYKVNSGGTATLIASNSGFPELIAFGTNIISYFSTLAVPTTTLALTDRLAIRYYVNHSGRTITLHTEDNHLCQIITTFTTGITALNGLTAQVQNFATGNSGTDFNIVSATATHTFNLPTASATNRGALSSADWSMFNAKQNALTNPVTGTGAQGRVAYWDSTGVIKSDSLFQWNDFSKRLGIGRTPTVSLDVEGAGFFSGTVTASSIIKSGGTSSQYLMADGSVSTLTNPVTGTGTTNYLPKFTGASTIGNSNLINDASGNLGLGVTPSAWASGTEAALQVGNTSIYKYSTYETGYSVNAYFNAGWKYISNDIASQYKQSSGAHYWYYAPSGTAGAAISFTQAMTLTSGGNLLVGTTTDNGARLQVSGTISGYFGGVGVGQSPASSGTTPINPMVNLTNNRNVGLFIGGQQNSPFGVWMQVSDTGNLGVNYPLLLNPNGGNVGIGTNSPNVNGLSTALTINGSSTSGLEINANSINQGYLIASTSAMVLNARTNIPLLFYTNDNERMRITSGGNVLIGTQTDSGARLYITGGLVSTMLSLRSNNGTATNINFTSESPVGSTDNYTINHTMVHGSGGGYRIEHNVSSRWIRMIAGTGGVELSGGATSWASISDIRVKNIIGNIENSLDAIKSLSAIKYTLKTDITNKTRVGLIAQEVQKVLPECVEVDEKGMLSVRYTELIPLLVNAIKELNEKIKI